MIGQWLREKRESWGLSSQDMIAAMGVSPTLISLVENDKRPPSVKFLTAYIETLAKAAGFDETLKETYLTDQNFDKWRESLNVSKQGGQTIYSSAIGKFLTTSADKEMDIETSLRDYFFTYAWRDFAYYQEKFFPTTGFKPSKHRLNKTIDLIEVLDLDETITSYWLDYYSKELSDFIDSNINNLPPAYRKLQLSFTKSKQDQALESQNKTFDLSHLEKGQLLLDGKLLTPKEKEIIYTMIEGIRHRRKFR